MKNFLRINLIIFLFVGFVSAQNQRVLVLGVGQDAGIPQMGCETPFCQKARKNPQLQQMVSSIALIDSQTNERWVFDATPDLPEQFQLLKEKTGDFSNNLSGIFLTHAHIGHYTGLMYLGRESMNAKNVKVYAMPRMKKMLENNAPWSQLVDLNNISLEFLKDSETLKLNPNLSVRTFTVPHRDEFSETVGFKISTEKKSLIFIPDIDKWQKWNQNLESLVKENDFLLLDGTFFADGEINRPMSEVPHPFVSETMELLKNLPNREKNKVFFIHFNHSNPLVQGNKKKLKEVRENGFNVVFQGQNFFLK